MSAVPSAASLADALRHEVATARPRLHAVSESVAAAGRGPGAWTRKEILGHLIDSASNNQQRFVLAALSDAFTGPRYDQDHWVRVHAYADRPWTELVDLWAAFNRHLAFAMAAVPPDRLSTPCTIDDGPTQTLAWLMEDYVTHMRHHLEQILDGLPAA
jgi:hypothetical protein